MTEWEATTLGALCERNGGFVQTGPFGSQLHAEDYVDDGVPVVMPQRLGDNTILEDGIARITEGDARRLSKHRLRAGDIVYSRRGDVERRALVRAREDGWLCGTGCLLVRLGDGGDVDPAFVSYRLGAPDAREWIVNHAVGATMPNLNTSILSALPLTLPSHAEQRAIAEVLGALDDKIAANTRLAATADELSAALYAAMLTDDTRVPLTALADFVNGRAFTKDASGTGRVVVRIAELNSGISGSTVYSDAEVPDQYLARPGDILFAWSGSLTLHRWYRPEAIVNQHIFKVVPRSDWPDWLVWHALSGKLEYFRAVAADKATTMGHIQRRHLDEPVPVPSRETVARHDAEMAALWHRALAAEEENLTLAATRDALLPALMSGALRVRDAERVVEATART